MGSIGSNVNDQTRNNPEIVVSNDPLQSGRTETGITPQYVGQAKPEERVRTKEREALEVLGEEAAPEAYSVNLSDVELSHRQHAPEASPYGVGAADADAYKSMLGIAAGQSPAAIPNISADDVLASQGAAEPSPIPDAEPLAAPESLVDLDLISGTGVDQDAEPVIADIVSERADNGEQPAGEPKAGPEKKDARKGRQRTDEDILEEMRGILASNPGISLNKLKEMLHIGADRARRLKNQLERPSGRVEEIDAEDVLPMPGSTSTGYVDVDTGEAVSTGTPGGANEGFNPDEELNARKAAEERQREQEETREEEGAADKRSENRNAGTIWGWTALSKKIANSPISKIADILMGNMRDRTKKDLEAAQATADSRIKIDENGVALDGQNAFDEYTNDELMGDRRVRDICNMMIERLINPSLLHIEGESIELRKEKTSSGSTITYARRTYDNIKKIGDAIATLRNLYGGCSTGDILVLVMLRAGLGIDINKKIAGVSPDKFELKADQFFELCRDIKKSQDLYGHPFALVDGPSIEGVRDADSSMFVLVGGTKCYPISYMPAGLFKRLSENPRSALHNTSAADMFRMMRDSWLYGSVDADGNMAPATYKILCKEAAQGENPLFQLKALEAMMRAVMSMDGMDAETMGLPSTEAMQTLMALQLEQEMEGGDPDIAAANAEKRKRMRESLIRINHRFRKTSDRAPDGRIDSKSERRRRKLDDIAFKFSGLTMFAKAARLGIIISAPVENMIGGLMQDAATYVSDAMFKFMDPDLAGDYAYTDNLKRVAETKEGAECFRVFDSLYRLGGKDMVNAFQTVIDDKGSKRFKPTQADLSTFLREIGVNGELSEKERSLFNVKPGQEKAFMSNVRYTIENLMLGSNLQKQKNAGMFIKLAMAEMGRSAAHNRRLASTEDTGRIKENGPKREAFTSAQVEGWAEHGGAQELFSSIMQTDAGWEAFMTLGNTTLGRKSPIEHGVRMAMAKNGLTSLLVRTCFDRFPEYGINKFYQTFIPFSNTLSYIAARGITSPSDFYAGNTALSHQMGGTLSYREGLMKNLLYDTVMFGEKLAIAGVYAGIMMALGGLHRPPDDRDRYTWSEWVIGEGEDATPIKWAWWMDDISGIGFPLGTAWAIMLSGGSTEEAANVFINAMANLNMGTTVFDAIDLFNNFDEEVDALFGLNVTAYDPSFNEWLTTTLAQMFWGLVGDATPAIIGELLPWTRDSIWRGDRDAHTASRVYDVGEGSRYSMEEAVSGNKTRQTGSYREYMRRRSAQNNVLQAFFYDLVYRRDNGTGYLYTEQPLDTMVDPYVQAMYNRFYLDLDPATSDLPIEQEARQAELYARAEVLCQYVDENFENPTQAALAGFVINPDARVNAINYCYHMMNEARVKREERLSYGYLDDAEWDQVWNDYYDELNHWKDLAYNYFQSDEIPWALPRYVRQESDRETRYVDDQGNPMNWLQTLGPNAEAHAEGYWYGNAPSLVPFSSPRNQGKGYNFETLPGWLVLDESGNAVNDVESMYDNAATLNTGEIARPGYQNKNVQELMWAGQGTNAAPTSNEQLNIGRSGNPTIGERPWRVFMETWPEWMNDLSPEAISEILGIPSAMPDENGKSDADGDPNAGNGGNSNYYYNGKYSRSGGSYSGGGGYTPRIYSTSGQVYGDRPSSMSTRSPYSPQRTYLNPGYYTSGSRKSYSRQQ
ncbi:MAG: hypothetical protein K5859_03505 [Atopobiaceae bacterium]|nr:hypothetical protein [Atopobiaceae bacterium]